jgi:hypothetical protein
MSRLLYNENKKKYSEFMKQIAGFIDTDKRSIPYTKKEYENLDRDFKQKNPYYCPDDYPYLCTINSDFFGLCKENIDDCENKNTKSALPIIDIHSDDKSAKYGKERGYIESDLMNFCGDMKIDIEETYDIDERHKMPNDVVIMTLNLMGILRDIGDEKGKWKYEFMKKRMQLVIDDVLRYQPDIICFQEMSSYTYQLLKSQLHDIYPYMYESNLEEKPGEERRKERGRDIETTIFSKYSAKKMTTYGLSGNLGYTDSMTKLQFDNFDIYDCYLQAGSKYSMGQEHKWYNYTRCRLQQIKFLQQLILESNRNAVVVGDFNFDLNGSVENWPEHRFIKFLHDSWNELHPDITDYSEDSDTNDLRWNSNFQRKKFRYDGILYFGNIIPQSTEIIAKNYYVLSEDESKKFVTYMTSKGLTEPELLRYHDKESKFIRLFPSDHYGIIAKFKVSM